MNQTKAVSIIICTSNRAGDLRRTLDALRSVLVPDAMSCELVVVDNASTDDTAEVVKAFRLTQMPVVYVHEPRRGKGYAYNTGMRVARGEVFLFTDDDVRPPPEWIVGMCEPILRGEVDALVGGIKIPAHLERPWMEKVHRWWLGSSDYIEDGAADGMMGANMAFSRGVLEKVPGFDPELGPGALGVADETLFTLQIAKAGYRVGCALDVLVEHCFKESQLSHASFLDRTKKAANSWAYIMYHWEHELIRFPRLRLAKAMLRLNYNRLKNRGDLSRAEGMSRWEMDVEYGVQFYKQYLLERKRAFNYEKRGLVKLRGE